MTFLATAGDPYEELAVESEIPTMDEDADTFTDEQSLLFLIYINDLQQAIHDSFVSIYADDTGLCYKSSDMTQLSEAIDNNLKILTLGHKATDLP